MSNNKGFCKVIINRNVKTGIYIWFNPGKCISEMYKLRIGILK